METTAQTDTCPKSYWPRRSMSVMPVKTACGKDAGHKGPHGPKPQPASPYEGTCQGCFKDQMTNGGNLVLHGYKRPGHGYIEGKCWGVGFVPYQLSCERTAEFLEKAVKPALVRAEANLVRLQAQPAEVSYEAKPYVGWENTPGLRGAGRAGYVTKFYKVAKGEAESYRLVEGYQNKSSFGSHPSSAVSKSFEARYGRPLDPKVDITAHVPAYERVLAIEVNEAEMLVRTIKDHITFLAKKVAEWKPVAWPVVKA